MNPENNFKNTNPDIRDFAEQIENFLRTRELTKLKNSFVEKLTILIISVFGLIAALAWDEALKELFYSTTNGLSDLEGKFLYASIITVLAVIISIVLSKLVLKKDI